MTPLDDGFAFCGIAIYGSPVCLKIKSSFQLYTFYIKELMKNGPDLQPGHRTTVGKHHPSWHKVLTRFGCSNFWRKVRIF